MATKTARKRAAFKTLDPMLVREKELYAKMIAQHVQNANGEGMTQIEAATLAKEAPSQISLICSGKLAGFSTDRLKLILSRLGYNVTTTITKTNGASKGKIAVSAK